MFTWTRSFIPVIYERHLQQEGWHYELDNTDELLFFKGVVFNEMKGNYSSPDSLASYEYSQRSLFPIMLTASIPAVTQPSSPTSRTRSFNPSIRLSTILRMHTSGFMG